jgi:hypothetical protein
VGGLGGKAATPQFFHRLFPLGKIAGNNQMIAFSLVIHQGDADFHGHPPSVEMHHFHAVNGGDILTGQPALVVAGDYR